jgi:hypothetical protein
VTVEKVDTMRTAPVIAALGGLLCTAALAVCATGAATTQAGRAGASRPAFPRTCPRARVIRIHQRGGTLRLPRCDGNVFTLGYPPNTATGDFQVTFTTYDDASQLPPNGKFGKPAGGTVIAWFEGVGVRNYVMIFCSNQCGTRTATLSGPGVLPSHPYLLYWYDNGSPQGEPERLGYPTCTSGTCTLGPFTSPLEGANLDWYDQDWYEIVRQ